MQEEERRLILDMVASGKITVEESLRLLESLGEPEEESASEEEGQFLAEPPDISQAEALDQAALPLQMPSLPTNPGSGISSDFTARSAPEEDDPGEAEPAQPMEGEVIGGREGISAPEFADFKRRFWQAPLWIGTGILVVSAMLMASAVQASGIGFWFLCASVPFLFGLLVLMLAWGARTSPWLHLRVQQPTGTWPPRITLAFPLPVRPAAWILRTLRGRIQINDVPMDEILRILETGVSTQNPISIEVDGDDDRIQLFIG